MMNRIDPKKRAAPRSRSSQRRRRFADAAALIG
jgi:hypothetical protein